MKIYCTIEKLEELRVLCEEEGLEKQYWKLINAVQKRTDKRIKVMKKQKNFDYHIDEKSDEDLLITWLNNPIITMDSLIDRDDYRHPYYILVKLKYRLMKKLEHRYQLSYYNVKVNFVL